MNSHNMYTDAILYFPSYTSFIHVVSSLAPDLVSNNNQINVFARTPSPMSGDKLLSYVRLTEEQKYRVLFLTQEVIPEYQEQEYVVTETLYPDNWQEMSIDEQDEYLMDNELPTEEVVKTKVVHDPDPELVGKPIVEILAQAPYGKDSADVIYNEIFNDADKLAKYKSVWNFDPEVIQTTEYVHPYGWDEMTEEEKANNPPEEVVTERVIQKPERFGQIAN